MSSSYFVYRLPLPSGSVVRVRKGELVLLAGGVTSTFQLLSAAFEAAPVLDDKEPQQPQEKSPLEPIDQVCLAVLVDREVREQLDRFDVIDKMAIVSWVTAHGVIEPAVLEGERNWVPEDFIGLIKGTNVTLIDLVCSRYGMVPSSYMGLSGCTFANDLDFAIAYRGARREGDSSSSDGEVEVEDMWGGKHKVPKSILPGTNGERAIHADSIARQMHADGMTTCSMSTGGNFDGSFSTRSIH